ncbi:NB-ARC domain-containing protein [Streptomyces mirabilis]|uniref:NB-ARC domain-containing protein n=1 Tax=Streptomyces mirabilis TaxID=68239 RepID=UPI00343E2158
MIPEPAPGRARTSAEDAPSGVEELSECLGDERSARALVEWAETMAVTVRPTHPKWAPSGKGYTGAVLAAVTITPGPGTDGVLWAQLGQDPPRQRIIAWARDLVTLLTGTEPPVYATVEAAGEHLGATLEGRRVLLVVDDVWRREDVEPFLRGGSGCVRLVTTRRPGVLDASAPLIRIDRMSSAQSLNLLAAGVEGADNTTLLPLFERSGNWPLALRLLNGVLRSMVHRSGMALPDVVAEMAEELDRYGLAGPLDAYPAPGTRTVEATVDLSLQELARIPRTGPRFTGTAGGHGLLPGGPAHPLPLARQALGSDRTDRAPRVRAAGGALPAGPARPRGRTAARRHP